MPDVPAIPIYDTRDLTRRYLLAFVLIALLNLISQGISEFMFSENVTHSLIINDAGRQRMYSQRISKLAILATQDEFVSERQYYRQQLAADLERFQNQQE